jgi:DNA-binding HxlR family transcriptional regulator
MYRPKPTMKQRIYYYLRNNGEVSGNQLESMASLWESKASVISRRARELVNEGVIERRLSEKGTVQYKLRPKENFDGR